LKPKRNRTTDQVTSELRTKIDVIEPALRVDFAGILSDLIGDLTSSPSPIEVRLFNENTAALQQTARQVAQTVAKIPGVVDVFDGIVVSGPALTFDVNPLEAARLGVNTTDVANTVTTAMTGSPASSILQQGRLITVRVVMSPSALSGLAGLKEIPIRSSTGNRFRLDQIANVQYDSGQTEIHRDALRQTISVTARLAGTDLGTAISAVQAKLGQNANLLAGTSIEYGGLYQQQQASFRELLLALAEAILLVFVVLLFEFRSFAHPVAIVTGAILALTGVFVALWVTGITLNVVSMVGMIMVVGIVAKNGILMLDAVEDHLAAGDTLTEALLRSGRRRFRPVLMTSLAAILGMLPLALALGTGAELLQPLAVAVIGGLAVALLLSLVLTPTIFAVLREQL
jgi:multidrug efflux pump subunit AcrB